VSGAAKETASGWSGERAESHLRSLELFGMRFGLDRMRRMMTVLDSPERRFQAIHVLGTNGKSSTTRMIAAILARHGLRTGSYLSPHLLSYTERIQISERDVTEGAFAAAIARAAWAAERVNRTLAQEDHVTQFELLSAAAYWELARREVDVAVIEAGLGGRYDATSVIDAQVTVLTNVGLEHTRWLGPTIADIAQEKLAALPAGGTLVISGDLHPEAAVLAEQLVAERGARLLRAASVNEDSHQTLTGYQRANFQLAKLAASAYLQAAGITLDQAAFEDAASQTTIAGRLQIAGQDPLTVLDGAHNPAAAAALVGAVAEITGKRPLALVLGVLEDKDAAGMLSQLLAISERAWFTAPPSARALSPAALLSHARQLGFTAGECEPVPARALAQAREWARRAHPPAAVLATGSIYLVGDLLAAINQIQQRETPVRAGQR
jgi:dihydrofolate synthase/folylpolyglutamate synthase